jgi:hypothetical protein
MLSLNWMVVCFQLALDIRAEISFFSHHSTVKFTHFRSNGFGSGSIRLNFAQDRVGCCLWKPTTTMGACWLLSAKRRRRPALPAGSSIPAPAISTTRFAASVEVAEFHFVLAGPLYTATHDIPHVIYQIDAHCRRLL